MRRRTFLSTTAAITASSLAGCSMFDEDSTSNPPTVTEYSFEQVDSSETPDDPTLEDVGDGVFTVAGTVTVGGGCTTIAVGSEPEFREEGRSVQTMIGTRETGEDACTQQIRYLGYRMTVEYDGDAPERVVVAQAGRDSTTVVLDVSKAASNTN